MTTEPTRRERLRPAELLIFSGVLAVFVGAVVLLVTRDLILALIFLGVAFVGVLVTVAMVVLAMTPNTPYPGEPGGELDQIGSEGERIDPDRIDPDSDQPVDEV